MVEGAAGDQAGDQARDLAGDLAGDPAGDGAEVEIRLERPGDEPAIHAVHAASFPTTAEAQLVDALRAAGRLTLSMVAVVEDRAAGSVVVGHVGFSPVTLEGTDDGLGLAPVAVLPSHRRRGVADRLIREGLAIRAAEGTGFVVLLGSPAYYSRFGFVEASRWNLLDEYGGGDAFQALELRGGAIPATGGRVRYAAEFAAFG